MIRIHADRTLRRQKIKKMAFLVKKKLNVLNLFILFLFLENKYTNKNNISPVQSPKQRNDFSGKQLIEPQDPFYEIPNYKEINHTNQKKIEIVHENSMNRTNFFNN